MKTSKKFWTIAIIILVLALVAGSAFAAVSDAINSIKGSTTSLTGKLKDWQGKYFTKQIIVNAIILTGLLYIALMILPKMIPGMDFMSSFSSYSYGNTNTAVFMSVIGILSLIISINAMGPTQYVWEKSWWQDGKLYLLGDDKCTINIHQVEINDLTIKRDSYYTNTTGQQVLIGDPWYRKIGETVTLGKIVMPINQQVASYDSQIAALQQEQQDNSKYCYTLKSKLPAAQRPTTAYTAAAEEVIGWGILRGTHLFVLIGSIIVYFLLFKTMGGEGLDSSVRWVLTIMFAANTASSGMPKSQFLHIAYWALLILVYKTFRKTNSEGKSGYALSAGLAFGVVNTMAVTAFPQYSLGLSMFHSPNFVTNFVIGLAFGLIIGSVQDSEDNFVKSGFGKLKGISGAGLKIAGRGVWNGIKLGGKGAAKLTSAGIKKLKEAIKLKWDIFQTDSKQLREMTDLIITRGRDDDLLYGKNHNYSRLVQDKKNQYTQYVNLVSNWAAETDSGRKKEKFDKIEEMEKRMINGDYLFTPGTTPTETNPTYDSNKKNKNAHKSALGIIDSMALEEEMEMQKNSFGI